MERLFRSLQTEWIPGTGYHSLVAARKDVSGYLMRDYNAERLYASDGGIALAVAEEKLKRLSAIS